MDRLNLLVLALALASCGGADPDTGGDYGDYGDQGCIEIAEEVLARAGHVYRVAGAPEGLEHLVGAEVRYDGYAYTSGQPTMTVAYAREGVDYSVVYLVKHAW